jgi:hypothetical protein
MEGEVTGVPSLQSMAAGLERDQQRRHHSTSACVPNPESGGAELPREPHASSGDAQRQARESPIAGLTSPVTSTVGA